MLVLSGCFAGYISSGSGSQGREETLFVHVRTIIFGLLPLAYRHPENFNIPLGL